MRISDWSSDVCSSDLVKRGIYVTELIGMGVNQVTGDYRRGASGFLIENGATGPAVAEITIAGNLLDQIDELTTADDLEFLKGINVPTLRIDGMMSVGGGSYAGSRSGGSDGQEGKSVVEGK